MLEGCDSQIAWEFRGMCELRSLGTVLDCWIGWNRTGVHRNVWAKELGESVRLLDWLEQNLFNRLCGTS